MTIDFISKHFHNMTNQMFNSILTTLMRKLSECSMFYWRKHENEWENTRSNVILRRDIGRKLLCILKNIEKQITIYCVENWFASTMDSLNKMVVGFFKKILLIPITLNRVILYTVYFGYDLWFIIRLNAIDGGHFVCCSGWGGNLLNE